MRANSFDQYCSTTGVNEKRQIGLCNHSPFEGKPVWRNVFSAQGAPPVDQEPLPQTSLEPPRKSSKKLYLLLGVVAVAAVLIAVVFMFSIPQGLGETIPYGVSYAVGEKLTYDLSATVDMYGQHIVETGTMSMHAVSFDGENYTIDEATHYDVQGASQDYSFTLIMNKAGQMVGGSNLPSQLDGTFSMIQGSPGSSLFLNRTDVRVGETIHIPLDMNYSGISMSGTENCKIGAVENVTVAAGTYKTFKIELSTTDFHISSQGVDASLSITGQLRMEYGTGHAIDFSMQATETASGMTMSVTVDMALTGDTME
jgi:hypothetical protein